MRVRLPIKACICTGVHLGFVGVGAALWKEGNQKTMESKAICFISHNTQDAHAQRCAFWIASQLRATPSLEVVVPQASWALGVWDQYLQGVVARAQRIIVVLTPDFLSSMAPFEEQQRRVTLQESLPRLSAEPGVHLLVVLAGACDQVLSRPEMKELAPVLFCDGITWADLTPAIRSIEACSGVLQAWVGAETRPE